MRAWLATSAETFAVSAVRSFFKVFHRQTRGFWNERSRHAVLDILFRMTRDVSTHSPQQTIAFGRTLVDLLAPPKLVLLRGDLGAGKTTLVKGIAAGFDAAEED